MWVPIDTQTTLGWAEYTEIQCKSNAFHKVWDYSPTDQQRESEDLRSECIIITLFLFLTLPTYNNIPPTISLDGKRLCFLSPFHSSISLSRLRPSQLIFRIGTPTELRPTYQKHPRGSPRWSRFYSRQKTEYLIALDLRMRANTSVTGRLATAKKSQRKKRTFY